MSGELVLTNPTLDLGLYARQFGLADAINWLLEHTKTQLHSMSVPLIRAMADGRDVSRFERDEENLQTALTGQQQAEQQASAWEALTAAFGQPDRQSDLVMSVVLLFNAHRVRVEEALRMQTEVVETAVSELVGHLQALVLSWQLQEAALVAEEQQLVQEQSEVQPQVETNLTALQTNFAGYTQAGEVSSLQTRATSNRQRVEKRLLRCHHQLQELRTQLAAVGPMMAGILGLQELVSESPANALQPL